MGTLLVAINDYLSGSAQAMVGIEDAEWCAEEVEGCFNPDWKEDVMGIEFDYGCGPCGVDCQEWSSFTEHWQEER